MDAGNAGADSRPWWTLVVAIAAFTTAVWLIVGAATEPSEVTAYDDAPMLQVAPGGEVALDALPAEHRVLYEAAAGDPAAFTEVRCYCGCEGFLDHRHLLDCFVRPGGGWERHATGCTVCLTEAEEVLEMRDDGVPLDEIVRRIDARYGAMTATT